ncbi:MAG: 7,8-didemethyl-8-hydroxy-5-deazariboflavin synthase subunit CofG [Cyanobacteria bacterium J06635_15]
MPVLTLTYSPAYTLVPTYECFNRCTYCNFRTDPLADQWLTLETARQRLKALQNKGIIEILLLSGEVHPQSNRRQAWFQRIYDLCALALELGFLPHTNAGPLSFAEMQQLKQVNVSMGLMLEQLNPQLLTTVHQHAPSKEPALRLQQLAWAGELEIPFTTGLLLGIGEDETDWEASLAAIAAVHQRHGHVQEVILQPHQPGSRQSHLGASLTPKQLVKAFKLARQILPKAITLQIPPNLTTLTDAIACIDSGARDLGGLVPKDEVNPDYLHHPLTQLRQALGAKGWHLSPRLPVYPQYDHWLPPNLRDRVAHWRSQLTLLAPPSLQPLTALTDTHSPASSSTKV